MYRSEVKIGQISTQNSNVGLPDISGTASVSCLFLAFGTYDEKWGTKRVVQFAYEHYSSRMFYRYAYNSWGSWKEF